MKSVQILFEGQYFHYFSLLEGETITIEERPFKFNNNGIFYHQQRLEQGKNTISDVNIWIYDTKTTKVYYRPNEELLICGLTDVQKFFTSNAKIRYFNSKVIVEANDVAVYHNYSLIKDLSILPFNNGNQLYCQGILIEVREDKWLISLFGDATIDDKSLLESRDMGTYDDFQRSPRIFEKVESSSFVLNGFPTNQQTNSNTLLKIIIPSLATVMTSFVMMALQPHSRLLNFSMVTVAIITVTMTSYYHIKDKHKKLLELENETISYENYLRKIVSQLHFQYLEEEKVLKKTYLDLGEMMNCAKQRGGRVFEKLPSHNDFLKISIGLGKQASSIKVKADLDLQVPRNRETLSVISNFYEHEDCPIPISLSEASIGIIGLKNQAEKMIESIMLQVIFYHSYRELSIYVFCSHRQYDETWSHWRRLNHFQLEEKNISTIVHDMTNQDMILNHLYRLISKRLNEDPKKYTQQWKWLVIVIADDNLLKNHGILDLFRRDLRSYHIALIFLEERKEQLQETVTTIIECSSDDTAILIAEKGDFKSQYFKPYRLNREKYNLLRYLSQINHVEAHQENFPKLVTLYDVYQLKTIEDWPLSRQWSHNSSRESLAVPIGVRATGEIISLDLHEKNHGPHGLVAGTTGSGKSELLQTLIISLALHYSPEEVGFLLIDFKGGGMANLFKNLPHLLGSITNLDGRGVQRALTSIQAELKRRQSLFKEFQVNHIDAYRKRYEDSSFPNMPSLPHLFLISDEFAELKVNCPEFMKELISISRIGRSLGLHLILATQKPTGVVDEQIWSNSRFRISLKVANMHDSRDILKTEDAAYIKEKGRAYLQVGNNELYEQFQTAWSGAKQSNQLELGQDCRIWKINELNQKQLLFAPDTFSQIVKEEEKTQLEATVDYINQKVKDLSLSLPQKPWLEELNSKLYLKTCDVAWSNQWQLEVPFGKIDLPDKQKQETFIFDLKKASHTLIAGVGQSGKTLAMEALILAFSRYNAPDLIQFHIFNFGNSHLTLFKDLIHVDDVISIDEEVKLKKMIRRIHREMESRKRAFKESNTSTYNEYFRQTGRQLPIIITFMDHFDSAKESNLIEDIELLLLEILRNGASLGLYLIVSVIRIGSLRLAVRNYFTTNYCFYMANQSELKELVGRNALEPIFIPGRAQTSLSPGHELQVFLPFTEMDKEDLLTNLKSSIEHINQSSDHLGSLPSPIPLLPEQFKLRDYLDRDRDDKKIFLGLDEEFVEPVYFDFDKQPYLVCLTDGPSQEEAFKELMKEQCLEETSICFDPEGRLSDEINLLGKIYQNHFDLRFKELKDLIQEKLASSQMTDQFLIILDSQSLFNHLTIKPKDFEWILRNAYKSKIRLIFQGNLTSLERSFNDYAKIMRKQIPLALVGSRLVDQQIIKAKTNLREPHLEEDEMIYVTKDLKTKIKLPSVEKANG